MYTILLRSIKAFLYYLTHPYAISVNYGRSHYPNTAIIGKLRHKAAK